MDSRIVNYSSSSEDEAVDPSTRISPPEPLPMFLKSDNKLELELNNQKELHQNRTRSFAHKEGNWASHVFIDCRYNQRIEIDKILTLLYHSFL